MTKDIREVLERYFIGEEVKDTLDFLEGELDYVIMSRDSGK